MEVPKRFLGWTESGPDLQCDQVEGFAKAVRHNGKEGFERILTDVEDSVSGILVDVAEVFSGLMYFEHEMPLFWYVIIHHQWDLLPILIRHGYDPNELQRSTRRRLIDTENLPTHPVPYKRLWIEGEYEYRSVLDCLFAYVLQYLGELRLYLPNERILWQRSKIYSLLGAVDSLIELGLNVNRIHSGTILHELATNFLIYLRGDFFDENQWLELRVIESLLKHGLARCEKNLEDGADPVCKWIEHIFYLVTHPLISRFFEKIGNMWLPKISRTAAGLLINLLGWRYLLPRECVAMVDISAELFHNMQMSPPDTTASLRLREYLKEECTCMLQTPPSLGLLARNQVRRSVGGVDFQRKVLALGLPRTLASFVIFIEPEHTEWIGAPPYLASLVGGWLDSA